MRILFIDQFSDFGGAQLALRELLDGVIQRRWLAEVMAPDHGDLHRACVDRHITSHRLPLTAYSDGKKTPGDLARYSADTLRSAIAIRNAARGMRADLIYVNGPRVLLGAVLAARSLGCATIFHTHSYLDRRYTRRIVRWCINRRDVNVLAISRFVAQPFVGAGSALPRIIHNGVNDHGFVLRPGSKPTRIGILGRIAEEKGHPDFIEAARQMTMSRPDLRFIVFGTAQFSDGLWERDLISSAQGAPVEFRGWTNDVSSALHDIDILAVPSGPAEGATRVILEAFSAGTPVVAYPSGGILEIVRDGETGCLTSGRGPEPLAAALSRLLDDPALMARLSSQGRQEWERRFRLERCQADVCGFIAEVVNRQATSGTRFESPVPESGGDEARGAQ